MDYGDGILSLPVLFRNEAEKLSSSGQAIKSKNQLNCVCALSVILNTFFFKHL